MNQQQFAKQLDLPLIKRIRADRLVRKTPVKKQRARIKKCLSIFKQLSAEEQQAMLRLARQLWG